MNSLLWKEWHENKLHFAVFMAWMLLAVLGVLGYEMAYRHRAAVGAFSGYAMFYTHCATIFVAMRVAQGEQTHGTLTFSAALPVSLRRVATFRVAGAVAALAIPVLVAAILLSLALASGLVEQALPRDGNALVSLPERETAPLAIALEQLWIVTAVAILGAIGLLIVLCLFGCWLRSQAQVGLLGVVLSLGAALAGGALWFGQRKPFAQLAYGALFPQSLVVQWGFGDQSGGSYTDHEIAEYSWISLGLSVPVLLFLGRLFVTQYGWMHKSCSASKRRRFRFATPPVLSHIPFRWPGRLAAMLWLELRQAVPLAMFGLLLAVLMSVAGVLMEPQPGQTFGPCLRAQMPHSTWVVATLWAAVVGSSLYSAELRGGLGGFWRSRPIPPGMWFSCKFYMGMVAVLGVLDGVTILVSWNAGRDPMANGDGMGWAYVACTPIFHAFIYTLAVLGTCWFRKPVLGGFTAILGYAVISMIIGSLPGTRGLDPIEVYNSLSQTERGGRIDFWQHGYPLVYGTLMALIVGIGLLSFRLARPLEPAGRSLATTEERGRRRMRALRVGCRSPGRWCW